MLSAFYTPYNPKTMKKITEIKPLKGFGPLKFGATQQEVEKILGTPQETEIIDMEGDIQEVEVWSYWEDGHAVYFEKALDNVCTNFETDHPDATLFGQKIFELNKDNIIKLMEEHTFESHEVEEDEELDELILFFHDAHLQFVFENKKLVLVSWAVAMDDEEEVEWP